MLVVNYRELVETSILRNILY